LTSCSAWGALKLTSINYAKKFIALGDARAPSAHPRLRLWTHVVRP